MQTLVVATWEVSWEMWDHRNKVLHDPAHPWKQRDIRNLNEWIEQETLGYEESSYLPKDRRLFCRTAENKIEHYSVAQKKQWIQSVEMARLRKIHAASAYSSSRILMRNWLLQGAPALAPVTATATVVP